MIEPTSSSPGDQHVTLREFETWQKAVANEATLRQTTLEEARQGLKELVDARFDAAQTALSLALTHHDRRLDEHAETLLRERAMVRDFLAAIRAADQIAISKAEESVNKRLEGMNELRAQIAAERAEYVRQDTYSARHDELISRISTLEQGQVGLTGQVSTLAGLAAKVNVLETGAANIAGRMTIVAFGITVFLTFVVIAVNFFTSKL